MPTTTKWTNESGAFVLDLPKLAEFEGTAYDLAERLGGTLVENRAASVRVALPCSADCLRRDGCWTYRSFYRV